MRNDHMRIVEAYGPSCPTSSLKASLKGSLIGCTDLAEIIDGAKKGPSPDCDESHPKKKMVFYEKRCIVRTYTPRSPSFVSLQFFIITDGLKTQPMNDIYLLRIVGGG